MGFIASHLDYSLYCYCLIILAITAILSNQILIYHYSNYHYLDSSHQSLNHHVKNPNQIHNYYYPITFTTIAITVVAITTTAIAIIRSSSFVIIESSYNTRKSTQSYQPYTSILPYPNYLFW